MNFHYPRLRSLFQFTLKHSQLLFIPHRWDHTYRKNHLTMKAIQILGTSKDDHRVVLNNNLPSPPAPSGSQALIKVHSAGITYDEVGWDEVYKTSSRIPGHDISGVVHQLGPAYSGTLQVGNEVYSMLHVDRGQGQAEYVLAGGEEGKDTDEEVVRKPKSLSHAQAAALPIPVLTAWEALFVHVGEDVLRRAGKKTRVLVTGASGAVGSIVVQLAARLFKDTVEVVALASSANHDRLRNLGANAVADYKTPDWEKEVGSVDAVIDTAGSEVLAKGWQVIKSPGGVIVTVADPAPAWAFGKSVPEELERHPGVRYVYFVVSLNGAALRKVGELIDEGTIQALPIVEYPVDQAVEAWEFAKQRSRKGKTVINFVNA